MPSEIFSERTNATCYEARQKLPPNFSLILKEFTREILREQPEDILQWSVSYFTALAQSKDSKLAGASRVVDPTSSEAAGEDPAAVVNEEEESDDTERLIELFSNMDDDRTGKLHVYFIINALMKNVGLTRNQALFILTSEFVEIDERAMTDYCILCRNAVPAMQYFISTKYDFEDVYNENAQEVHGFTREDVEQMLMQCAVSADSEGLGKLSYSEFKKVLINVPLHLTRRDIAALLAEAEVTTEGAVVIRNEVEAAFCRLLLSSAFTKFEEQNQES